MKKYIKYFSKNKKRQIRFAATNDIEIGTKLHSDRMEITFIDKNTGEPCFIVALYAMDKTIAKMCHYVKEARLAFVVEMFIRSMAAGDYKKFLASDFRTFSINKYGKEWNFHFNLYMKVISDDKGNEIQSLANNFKKLSSI